MLKPRGYLLVTNKDSDRRYERDTFTCFHCQQIVEVKPFTDGTENGGYCSMCGKLICQRCLNGACTPFEARLDQKLWRRRYEELTR